MLKGGVHKVSLQFQKFITEANKETDKWKLLQNETYVFKFFLCFTWYTSIWEPLVARSTSGRYSISYTIDVFLRCSWSFTSLFTNTVSINFSCHARIDEHNWWISFIFSSEVSLRLQIRFGFDKPWYALCLLSRSSHFVRGSFNSILFISRAPEMQRDKNLDNHRVYGTNLTNVSRRLPL